MVHRGNPLPDHNIILEELLERIHQPRVLKPAPSSDLTILDTWVNTKRQDLQIRASWPALSVYEVLEKK